jgi:hypothetical protein
MPAYVNDQIIDSVTQVNTKMLGDAPAVDIANLDNDITIPKEQVLDNADHTDSAEEVCDKSSAQVLADAIRGSDDQRVL